MAKARYKPNRRNAPILWPETGRLVHSLAESVARRNNAQLGGDGDVRAVVVESTAGEVPRKRHRAAVIAASGPAIRDQARTSRLLTVLSQTRV